MPPLSLSTHAPALPLDAVKPDYGKGGLFALVGSIRAFLDGGAFQLPGLSDRVAPAPPRNARAVFWLIDGLGDAFLQRHGAGSRLLACRQTRLTSVFPSTTAAAVTTTLTGLAPAGHGLTGWFIRDTRFGGLLAPLPMMLRAGGSALGVDEEETLRTLFPYDSLFSGRVRTTLQVAPQHIAFSPFSRHHGGGTPVLPYQDLAGLVDATLVACDMLERQGGYVHVYYPFFDALSHDYGCESEPVLAEFARLDRAFGALCDRLAGQGVDVVVSADHGLIDSPDSMRLNLDDAPHLQALLAAPLSGERRAAFCHVRPGCWQAFETEAAHWLGHRGVCVRSEDLLQAGWFGPQPWHARIDERIGTHTVLMQPGWTVADTLPGERPHPMIGVHGGVSAAEMWVPLIHAVC